MNQSTGFIWAQDNETGASVQRETITIPNKLIEKVLTKAISSRLESLEKQVGILKENKELCVSDDDARRTILTAIQNFKSQGIKEIDIIDLHSKTRLPIAQINKIMEELESEGTVTEYG